jgi:phage terminase large subunit GpA-like protein
MEKFDSGVDVFNTTVHPDSQMCIQNAISSQESWRRQRMINNFAHIKSLQSQPMQLPRVTTTTITPP